MFGPYYSYYDRALKDGTLGAGPRVMPAAFTAAQLEYARELLADVLNRCNYVALAAAAASNDCEKEPDLRLVLQTFEADVAEARLRARRAGLLREEPIGWMTTHDGTETAAQLEYETGDDLLVTEVVPDHRRKEAEEYRGLVAP